MSITKLKSLLALGGLILVMVAPVEAQQSEQHRHGHTSSPAPKNKEIKPLPIPTLTIPDVEVLDQEGRKQKFYTDLVKGKIVVINFVFTTCKSMCPLLATNFSRLQTALGERLNKEVFLISVSTDPETDSPERLKAWGEKFKAKDGWTFVTGNKEQLTPILQVFTGDGPRTGYHIPSLYVVNGLKNAHRPAYGFESAENVLKLIDELAN
ncbi:MAG: SCO family protein [Acidobacteria bacterium]|nr:SCO family protein [Acidobacteriota bacterium]